MLKIGEKIKELRKAQDVTQEKLADYLNISYQAVSKWENGLALPDLSLIPALSNFFGVTSDYLLGIKADENEEKINEYFEKAMNCSHTGDMEKGIEIIREALKTYPNNSKLLSVLIGFLFGSFCANGQKEILEEIVAKAELVLQDSTNEEERIDVLEKLAYSYNYLEMQDKAIETANRLPDTVVNRQLVLSNIIMPMNKRKEKKQECVFYNFEVMINNILWLGGISLGRKEFSKAIDIYKSDRNFISEALPVFIGEQQHLFTEGYSILALKTDAKLRIGIFKNGGKDTIDFDIPNEFANGKLTEIYPCKDNGHTAELIKNHIHIRTSKNLCAVIYEIKLN
jgi:transcriptional regulator with XRE-family HTH domain